MTRTRISGNAGFEMTRTPTPNLPPPYTWTDTRPTLSRYVTSVAGSSQPDSAHSSPFTLLSTPRNLTNIVLNSQLTRNNRSDLIATSIILVGPKQTPFHIHTSLLITQSSYFRVALTGHFLESTTNCITLEDVSVEQFQLLTSWLYSSILPTPFKDGKPAYYTLINIYALADRFALEGLRNAVVDVISDCADRTNSVLTPSDTVTLYEDIRDSAPLRQLILDLFAFKKTDRLLENHADWWHETFLRDLTVRLKRPCEQALDRHRLRMWCPESWHTTRACEYCRMVLPPRLGAVACEDCCAAFCTRCVEGGTTMAGWDHGHRGRIDILGGNGKARADDEGAAIISPMKTRRLKNWEACKPWRGARCALYHEHTETERCGDVFLGR